MEFFERLYRGFEAEHYVARKLFSAGDSGSPIKRFVKRHLSQGSFCL